MSSYGLTPQGFVPRQQQQIIADINTALQQTFGNQINLGAESVFGQIVGVFSEEHAKLWQALQALYASWTPEGAEGVAVDNILALSNLTRLPATASVTDPTPAVQTNGVTLYGLVLYGTPGTTIPAGSLIKSTTTPQITFRLDSAVTIDAAANAVQGLVYSNTPTLGAYTLSLIDTTGATVTTAAIPYNALATQAQLVWGTAPSSGSFYLMFGDQLVGPIAYNASAYTIQTAIQAAGGTLAAVTVLGSIAAGLNIVFPAATYNHTVSIANTAVTWASAPASGTFVLTLGGTQNTTALAYNASAATVQAALVALGYPRVKVAAITGSNPGYAINWVGTASPPAVTVTSNTTGVSPTVGSTNTLNQTPTVVNSIQSAINNAYNAAIGNRPFTDVTVTGAGTTFALNFGAIAPQGTDPSSAAHPVPTVTVASNTMFQSSTVTNVAVTVTATGAPAQATGTATCTVTGPNALAAGQLSIIGSPVTGWTGVTNQLDVLPGSNVESDTDALIRRADLVSSQANGPLASIVQKVKQLSGVTQAIGFQNITDAAIQTLTFAATPTTGSFQILLQSGPTAAIAYNATAATVQAAINAVAGYATVQVTGSVAFGFALDFNGAFGGQYEPLILVINNTTGVAITPAFGRPPKSFEIVVQGGTAAQIAKTIYGAMPAGIQSYGTPAAVTTGTVTAGVSSMMVGSATGILVGQAIFGLGVASGATVSAVSGTTVTMSAPAIGSYSNVAMTFGYAAVVTDSAGNPVVISFSRPAAVLFYVTLNLITDQYRTPGVPSSGANPQSKFLPGSITQIQQDIVSIGNATTIGGLVIGYGTGGLIGAFNEVPGIVGYTLNFGPAPNPSGNANVQLLPTQTALFQTFNVAVTYT